MKDVALGAWRRFCVAAMAIGISAVVSALRAEDTGEAVAQDEPGAIAEQSGTDTSGSGGEQKSAEKSKYPPYSKVLGEGAEKKEGVLTLHRKDEDLFLELKPSDFDRDFIVLITIARGIGQRPLLGGYSWGFGDDWVWQFRRVGDRIQIVRRNVRFKAKPNTPSEKAVKLAYTDSVLFSLPIATRGPGGSYVINLGPVFMTDLPQIGQVLPGFSFNASRSVWADVNAYPKNVEIQVAATYASSGTRSFDSVPDSRGATVNVHYSISRLPENGYRPRVADDRIGYFVTAVKDFSRDAEDDRFVRYINRWHLEKSEPSAETSPPKENIVFYLEKTIPFKYRKPIRDGIAEWNKAFEKAGFYDAIDVRQQPDDATWEPGDVRYNTFRWITSEAGFAMGPSRVNPLTGQILDADIIFDADFLQTWKSKYETFTPKGIEMMTGGQLDLDSYHEAMKLRPSYLHDSHSANCSCNLLSGMSHQFALGAAISTVRKRSPEEMEKLIMQGLKEVTMHEVGHTLGLRHNFKASTLYSLEEANDVEKTSKTGVTASVMDYNPVNLVPAGVKQGDFYSTTVGPYDYWAIEYGYKPLKASSTEGELKELQKIASRSGEPGLAFSTDEDTRGIDPDPHSFRFDLGNDLVAYAKQQAQLVTEAMPGVVESMIEEGEGYERARRAFGVLLGTHGQAMFYMSRYVGGVHVSRHHKGDKDAKMPFEVVSAEQQRQAMETLGEHVFCDAPFAIPTALYNHLAPTRWSHWGASTVDRPDYPVHEVILMWQQRILNQLMSPLTLTRLHDSELKVDPDQDAYTTVELFGGLTKSIFGGIGELEEGEFTNRKPAIASLKRTLQRAYVLELAELSLGRSRSPEDCKTLAYVELTRIKSLADAALARDLKLDDYSRAHLQETSARIAKALDAHMIATP